MGKSILFYCVLVLSDAVFFSCGGKPDPCSKVCAYAYDCWGEDGLRECQETCPALVKEAEAEGYDANEVADCIIEEATCMDIAISIDSVIEECKHKLNPDAATDSEPDPVVDPHTDPRLDFPVDEIADPLPDLFEEDRGDPSGDEVGDGPQDETADISAQEACVTIGHAYCDRRDDCLGEHPPDVRRCRDDVDLQCQSRSGMVSQGETLRCESEVATGDCAALFDAAENPLPIPSCPDVYP